MSEDQDLLDKIGKLAGMTWLSTLRVTYSQVKGGLTVIEPTLHQKLMIRRQRLAHLTLHEQRHQAPGIILHHGDPHALLPTVEDEVKLGDPLLILIEIAPSCYRTTHTPSSPRQTHLQTQLKCSRTPYIPRPRATVNLRILLKVGS